MSVFDEIGHVFEESRDLTIGIEEEFQILDGQTLALTNRFEDLKAAGEEDWGQPLVFGELIQSEAEIKSVRGDYFAQVREDLWAKRVALARAADSLGLRLCATGVHPFSPWEDQAFIDSPHYQYVVDSLQYVAWTNNTFGLHVHVGVNGADRAVALCDAFRTYLPPLLALSASSPFYRGMETGLHSTRAQVFLRAFPRCGIPDVYGDWATYADYAQLLYDTDSIEEPTHIWWTLRTHHTYGTLEVRVCDGQPRFEDSMGISGLVVALIASLMDDYDHGRGLEVYPNRYLEENRWRALRFGLDGYLINLQTRKEEAAAVAVERLLERSERAAQRAGVEKELARVAHILGEGNQAQRQLWLKREGVDLLDVHRFMTNETMGEFRKRPPPE